MTGWLPENVSSFGAEIDGVFWLIFYITAVCFFLTEGLILYFIFRYRRKPGRKAAYAAGDTWGQFAITTIIISVPFGLLIFSIIATLWGGSMTFKTPMLFALGSLGTFIFGGLTGIFNGSAAFDIYIHDTYFVVAHFHYTLIAKVFFAAFAGIYFWFPKMFGRMMNEALGKIHFWLTFIFFNAVFGPMHLVGLGGMMRRIANPTQYDFLKPIEPLNVFITLAAILLILSQITFVINSSGAWSRAKPPRLIPGRRIRLNGARLPATSREFRCRTDRLSRPLRIQFTASCPGLDAAGIATSSRHLKPPSAREEHVEYQHNDITEQRHSGRKDGNVVVSWEIPVFRGLIAAYIVLRLGSCCQSGRRWY